MFQIMMMSSYVGSAVNYLMRELKRVWLMDLLMIGEGIFD
jgi:hypothetical protein